MPGYGGKRMEIVHPEPTDDVNTVEHRFVMPSLSQRITLVQFLLVGLVPRVPRRGLTRKVNEPRCRRCHCSPTGLSPPL